MLKKRIIGFIVMLLAAALTGCGKDTKEEGKVEGEPVTVRFMGYKAGSELGNLTDLIEAFEKENPLIHIEYETIPTAAGYNDSLKARMAAGEDLDIIMTQWNNIPPFAQRGHLEPLTEERWVNDIMEIYRPLVSYEGEVYGFPIEIAGVGMYVNTAILEAYKLQVPMDWDSFAAVCEILKNQKTTPLMMGNRSGYSAALFLRAGEMYYAFDRPGLAQEMITGQVKPSQVCREALTRYKYMMDNRFFDVQVALELEQADSALTEFVNGKSVFFIGGSWDYAKMEQIRPQNTIRFYPLPIQDGDIKAHLFPGGLLSISSGSRLKEEALAFLEFWSREENFCSYLEGQMAFSPLRSFRDHSKWTAEPFSEYVTAENILLFDIPGVEEAGDWGELSAASEALSQGKSVDEVCLELDEKISGRIREQGAFE